MSTCPPWAEGAEQLADGSTAPIYGHIIDVNLHQFLLQKFRDARTRDAAAAVRGEEAARYVDIRDIDEVRQHAR